MIGVVAWQHCSPLSSAYGMSAPVAPPSRLLGEGADNFGGDMEEEYGGDEGE